MQASLYPRQRGCSRTALLYPSAAPNLVHGSSRPCCPSPCCQEGFAKAPLGTERSHPQQGAAGGLNGADTQIAPESPSKQPCPRNSPPRKCLLSDVQKKSSRVQYTTPSSGSSLPTRDRSARAALPAQRHAEQQGEHPTHQQQVTTRKTHNTQNYRNRSGWVSGSKHTFIVRDYVVNKKKKKMTIPDPPN